MKLQSSLGNLIQQADILEIIEQFEFSDCDNGNIIITHNDNIEINFNLK